MKCRRRRRRRAIFVGRRVEFVSARAPKKIDFGIIADDVRYLDNAPEKAVARIQGQPDFLFFYGDFQKKKKLFINKNATTPLRRGFDFQTPSGGIDFSKSEPLTFKSVRWFFFFFLSDGRLVNPFNNAIGPTANQRGNNNMLRILHRVLFDRRASNRNALFGNRFSTMSTKFRRPCMR